MNIEQLERLLAAHKAEETAVRNRAGQSVYLSVAIETFILDARAGGLADATVRWYSSLLNAFANTFPGAQIGAMSTNALREYIVALQARKARYTGAPQRPEKQGALSPQTIAGHVTALHAFWKWAGKEYSIANPMSNVKRQRRPAPQPRAIASADFVKMFEHCGDDDAGSRNRALLAFLVDTGVRVSGLVRLKAEDLLLPNLQAVVREKGDKTRIVVYTRYTRALVALWLDMRATGSDYVFTSLLSGEALTASGVDQLLRRLKKAAGVKGRVNPHSFRHAFAREYLKAGGDAIRLAKLIGHTNVNTTAAYYAIFTPDELATMHEDYSPLRQIMESK